jgi:hypothetical protein
MVKLTNPVARSITAAPVDHPFKVFPASALGRSIIDRFEAIVRRFGARLAIQDTAVSLTYAELGGWAIGLLQ